MTLITDLDAIKQLAAQRRDEFEVMRYMLEAEDPSDETDAKIDAIAEATATPIIDAIDCTQCANCCRSLDVYLTRDDAARLAQGVDIALHEVETRYIDHAGAQAVDEWGKFRAKPCAFLQGKLCNIYAHRPDSCRDYPVFTPMFRWILEDMIEGAALCPIIYNVLDAMQKQVDVGLKLE
jgi:uncharacterized protein